MEDPSQSLLLVAPGCFLHWSICLALAQARKRLMILDTLSNREALRFAVAASSQGAVVSPWQVQPDLLLALWESHLRRAKDDFGSLTAILCFLGLGELADPISCNMQDIWPDLARRSASSLSTSRPSGHFILVAPESAESHINPCLDQIAGEWSLQKCRARIGAVFHAPDAAPAQIAQRLQQKLGQTSRRRM